MYIVNARDARAPLQWHISSAWACDQAGKIFPTRRAGRMLLCSYIPHAPLRIKRRIKPQCLTRLFDSAKHTLENQFL